MNWFASFNAMSPSIAALALLIFAVTVAMRSWPQWKRAQNEGDASLRTDLLARVATLELEIIELRKALDQKDRQHEAEMRVVRHQLGNETASIEALLMLLETAPDKVAASIDRIKAMRAQRAQNIAIEKAGIFGGMAGKDAG